MTDLGVRRRLAILGRRELIYLENSEKLTTVDIFFKSFLFFRSSKKKGVFQENETMYFQKLYTDRLNGPRGDIHISNGKPRKFSESQFPLLLNKNVFSVVLLCIKGTQKYI